MNDDFNEKPKRQGRQSQLDFVIPLQLEECIHHVKHFSSTVSLQIAVPSPNTEPVKLYFNCEIDPRASGSGEATLRRWEGTSTRFEGEVQLRNPISWVEEFLLVIVLPIVAVFFGLMIHLLMTLFITTTKDSFWQHPLFYAFIAGGCGMWIVVRRMYNRRLHQVKIALMESLLKDNREA